MTTILQINAGLHGAASTSSILADRIAARIRSGSENASHIMRDLSADPIPHLDGATFRSFSDPVPPTTPPEKTGKALSDRLISELKQADYLVLGVPMYNLMIPSTLKSWIDHVTRAGETFHFTKTGPVGLVDGVTAYLAIAQGGQFLGTPDDLVTLYLRAALGLIGIRDVTCFYAQGLAAGPQAAEAGLRHACTSIDALLQAPLHQTSARRDIQPVP